MRLLSTLTTIASLSASVLALRELSFVLIGDSTTNNTTVIDSGGWSNGFCASLAGSASQHCINTAHNGATTGSTIASGASRR